MRNMEELIDICKTYYIKKKSSSGLNSIINSEEIKLLQEHFECKRLNECLHIIIHGYIGICKICQKRTEYIDITKLYRKYCCHKCSLLDREVKLAAAKKGKQTVIEKNIKPNIKKEKINCKYCGIDIIKAKKTKTHSGFCDSHKKICHCGIRHDNAGKCCSMECTNLLKYNTNMKNSGKSHNLLIDGVRRNQIEFYLNRGHSYEESIKMVSEFQTKNCSDDTIVSRIFSKGKFNELSDYLNNILSKIKDFKYKEIHKPYDLISLFCSEPIIRKYGHKYLYDRLYKMDSSVFKYEKVDFKKSMYGYLSYTDKGELLRSKLEYDFYRLLKINNIEYKIDKKYPTSNYRYDFYIIEKDIYVEIAGLMHIKEYFEKMQDKLIKNKNVHILTTYNEMLVFIQNILGNEN